MVYLPPDLISIVEDPKIKLILVLGGSDTGKTTLVESLIKMLKANFSLGVIDCDIGQSHIEPPTTIAWARVKKDFTFLEDQDVQDFYFVGDISPAGCISRCLEGVDSIFKKAQPLSDKIFVDTDGYITTQEAVDFKIKKIQILKPDVIIALQRTNELEEILKSINVPFIFRMSVPNEVKQKSPSQRALFRQMRFEKYFSSAFEVCLGRESFINLNAEADLINRIVCLVDSSGKHLALGIIKRMTEEYIYLLTPLKELAFVSSIIVGKYIW